LKRGALLAGRRFPVLEVLPMDSQTVIALCAIFSVLIGIANLIINCK
jgi:hypothetical protein